MPMKQEQHTIMGMQRDLTVSKFNPQFAYENMNIRITARENSTLLSVSNEKGTSIVEVTKIVKPNKITVEPNGNITSEFPVESIVKELSMMIPISIIVMHLHLNLFLEALLKELH